MMTPNYAPRLIGKPLVKPERATRKAAKRKVQRGRMLTRAHACKKVWFFACGRCERCHRRVSRDVSGWRDERAQFNERVPRSLGGDPTDPANIELTCRVCHFGGPSGAHAPTAARMVKR